MHEVGLSASAMFPSHPSSSSSSATDELSTKDPTFVRVDPVPEENDEDEDENENDFSFVCMNPDGSPICADEAFVNGQIRPVFPMFDRRLLFPETKDDGSKVKEVPSVRPQLKKLFMEELCSLESSSTSEAEGLTSISPEIYCEWSPRKVGEASPELGKKSHSTGFSKLWRFRDMIRRSSSDGKDTFVFLRNPSSGSGEKAEKPQKTDDQNNMNNKLGVGKTKGEKKQTKGVRRERETASSYHERHYARNRAEIEMNKRKSYLPYRNNLMGFFTNVNGLSRNLHPF